MLFTRGRTRIKVLFTRGTRRTRLFSLRGKEDQVTLTPREEVYTVWCREECCTGGVQGGGCT